MRSERIGKKAAAFDRMSNKNGTRKKSALQIALFAALLLTAGFSSANAALWRNHTNVNAARDLFPTGDSVWAATTGGLTLFIQGEVKTFTNADGLGDNRLLFVTADVSGRLWTGGEAGRLSSWDPSTGAWDFFNFIDRDGRALRLTAAAGDGDILWVSSNIGVHKFDTRHFGGEIKETYRRFGNLPADAPVNDVLITDGYVWVATGSGCAVARTDDINLQDYSRWRSFDRFNSDLVDDNVTALAEYDGLIYAGTNRLLYRFEVSGGDSTWSSFEVPQAVFYDLFSTSGGVLAATSLGIAECTGEGCRLLSPEGMVEKNSRAVCKTADGVIWASSSSGKGYSLYDGSAWVDSTVAGIVSNDVNDIAITAGGRVWAVHPNWQPMSMWDGLSWQGVDAYVGGPTVNSAVVDHEGYLWLGGHGTAVTRLNPADPDNDYQRFDQTNSPLRGNLAPPEDDTYVIIWDIVVDSTGRVWMANTFDYADRVLVFYDHGCWGYFGIGDGFPVVEPISLFPLKDEVLVGLLADGLVDFELDSTVAQLCEDGIPIPQTPTIAHFDETDGLPTSQVRCIYVDLTRKVWVGTSGGLAYYDRILRKFRKFPLPDLPAPTINSLVGDGGNNLWVGAEEGLFLIDPDGTVTRFGPDNSGLVDPLVKSLTIDEKTSTLWVGTAGGISELIGLVESPTPVEQIIAYPNPFIITEGDDTLRFDAVYGTTLQIYSAAGELVAEIDISEDRQWDGRNEAGRLVASGIYLFVARDQQGNYGRGKFAVLRK